MSIIRAFRLLVASAAISVALVGCQSARVQDPNIVTIGTFNIEWLGDGNDDLKPRGEDDYRLIAEPGTGGLSERANLVDLATATLVEMLADLQADPPSDEKGRALIPLWIADYNIYIGDRRAYSAALRTQSNAPFAESTYEGLPLSERIATFAGDNRMPSCSPPIDLSV